MFTNSELMYLSIFLSNVEEHLRCDDPTSDEAHYYPDVCLNAILARYKAYNLAEILKKIEEELLERG